MAGAGRTGRDRWIWFMAPLWVLALYLNFIWTPDDRMLLSSQRIFYFHMGAATAGGLAYLVTFVASLAYLRTRTPRWDIVAAASAEVGTVLTTMILVSGILWGRAAWGVWWTWDPRLTTTVILWVIFAGYLLLREWSDNPERRALYSAVVAILAYVDVPIDYMAVRWWNSIHPVVITSQGIAMAPRMIVAMFVSMAALLYLFAIWMAIRLRLLRAEAGLADIKNRLFLAMQELEG